MIKSELVQRMASRNPHLYHRDLERIVKSVFDEITLHFIVATGSSYVASAFF